MRMLMLMTTMMMMLTVIMMAIIITLLSCIVRVHFNAKIITYKLSSWGAQILRAGSLEMIRFDKI